MVVFLVYRKIQLLFSAYNDIHKRGVMPLAIFLTIVTFAVGAYPLISQFDELDLVLVIILINVWAMAFTVLRTCFYITAFVHSESGDIIGEKRGLGNSKLLRKYWNSFPTMKIYFFETNYFETGTSLVILDFAINMTINLVLLE